MHDEYRRLKFGLVPVVWRQPQVDASEQILMSFLRTFRSFDMGNKVTPTLEVFGIAKQYVGNDFRNWLIANYNNGIGVRASLAKIILSWVNGKVSSPYVIQEVKRDLNRLDFLTPADPQLSQPVIYDGRPGTNAGVLDFSPVKDRHFFEFITVLGPELTAHLLLSFNGIRFQK